MKAHIATLMLASAMQVRAANAQSGDPTARLRRGVELRREGRDEEARAEFQQAYDAAPTPVAAGQLGLAEMALGQWVASEAHVREAMAVPTDDWVQRNRATLVGALAGIDQHVGRVDVRGTPVGATVLINTARVGALPLAEPARVVVGTATLEVRAPGFVAVIRPVDVAPGALTREIVELSAAPSAAPAPALRRSPADVDGVDARARAVSGSALVRQPWIYATATSAAVFGVAGTAMLIWEIVEANRLGGCAPSSTIDDCPSASFQWSVATAGTAVGYGVSAVSLLAVVLLVATTPRRPRAAPSRGSGPWVIEAVAGGVGGRFF